MISVVAAVAACLASAAAFSAAAAESYPSRPVRMLVGNAPGGSTDVTARLLAHRMSELLGQPVIVENRAGASGLIALERAATAAPDGHTLLMIAASSTVNAALGRNGRFDLLRDMAPVSLGTIGPYVMIVNPQLPAKNVRELIDLARAKPRALNYGSNGVGSALHLAGELFKSMAGIDLVHVPYKGGSESAVATANGQVAMSFTSPASALAFLNSKRLSAFAVTSLTRTSLLPAVPTLHESGLPGYERIGWYGLLAPAGVPKHLVDRLSAVIAKSVNDPKLKSAFVEQGLEPRPTTPAEFRKFIAKEIAENAKLLKLAGVKAE